MEVRAMGTYDVDMVSFENGIECGDESLTVQSDAVDADINVLVRRFGLTGTMPVLDRLPIQADFVQALDFRSALDALREAEASFMELPADVRRRFAHDPGEFVAFCSDPANLPELRKMGLAVPEEVVAAPVAPEAPSA